jgi:regulator of protease activity HflC (stomatin/prohibitin superfamily)
MNRGHAGAQGTIRAPAAATYEEIAMRSNRSFAVLIFILILGAGAALAYAAYRVSAGLVGLVVLGCAFILAIFISSGIQVADQWSRAVVLRLGKFRSLQGPGLFLIIPVIDSIPYWIDTRVLTSSFKAEKTLTKDTVPVDVDAVLFWKIVDPKKAALDVADYQSAISWASQTALRDVIGKTMLSDMLEGRDKISDVLRKIIDERTEPWGINVISVEVKDVLIPASLEDAMSMQAQAERERQARVILGDSERQVAEKFGEAAKTYLNNPVALHLRAMNMLYEGLKANSTIVIVPSTAVESMQLGGLAGLTALTMGLGQEQTRKEKDGEPVISSIPTPTPENDLLPVSRAEQTR